MSKAGKIIVSIVSILVVLFISGCLLFVAFWNGALNFMFPNEIATYSSPNGEYSLVFEQMGDPEWPFGATDVRLTLKDHNGKIVERVSEQLNDDGANASESNISAIFWEDDEVIVILSASEMNDKEVSIAYNPR